MKTIVNNQLVEYVISGREHKKTVLLLHGWGMNLRAFDQLADDLAKNYQVIRFDFPGFGSSPKPADNWGVTEYAHLTGALLEKLKVQDLYAVVGHSFGGRVIIKSQTLKTFTPEKTILIGAAGIKPKMAFKRKALKVVAKSGNAVMSLPGLRSKRAAIQRRFYTSIGSEDYLNADAMKQIFLNTINEDLSKELPNITQPTLLIWGENDTETPVSDARYMNEHIKDSELHILPDAGHFVYTEAYPEVKRLIEGFLG